LRSINHRYNTININQSIIMVNRRRQLARACKKFGLLLQPNTVDPLLQYMDSVQDDNENDDNGSSFLVDILSQLQRKLVLLPVPGGGGGGPKLITLPLLEQVLDDHQRQQRHQQQQRSGRATTTTRTTTATATTTTTGSGFTNSTSTDNHNNNKNDDARSSSFTTVSRDPERLGSTNHTTSRSKLLSSASISSASWHIIPAFSTPKLSYDSMRQQFRYEGSGTNNNNNNNNMSLMGSAKSLLDMRTRRFTLVHQRVVRFRQKQNLPDLTTIDRLLGSTSTTASTATTTASNNNNNYTDQQQVLLGMLRSNPSLGCLDLEDLTGSIALQITLQSNTTTSATTGGGGIGGNSTSNSNKHSWNGNTMSSTTYTHIDQKGLYMEGSIVVVNGIYDNGVFLCSHIELPPLESASETKPYLPPPPPTLLLLQRPQHGLWMMNMSGSTSGSNNNNNNIEPPAKIYSMSNVALDDSDCIQRLEAILAKIQADDNDHDDDDDMDGTTTTTTPSTPVLLVLFGNFVTESMTLSTALDELARLIQDVHPRHTILIIPGPADAIPNAVWPLPPLLLGSSSSTGGGGTTTSTKKSLLHQMSNVYFGTNPCRLTFVGQDGHSTNVVLLRKDMIRESLQHQVLGDSCGGRRNGSTPTSTTTSSPPLASRVIHHMMSQGHIMPQSPTYWNHDHAMGLYPLPDLMIVGLDGDVEEGLEYGRAQCRVVVPGSSTKQGVVQITLLLGAAEDSRRRRSSSTTPRFYVEFLSEQHNDGDDDDDDDDDNDYDMHK
jgi:hypothetical protein